MTEQVKNLAEELAIPTEHLTTFINTLKDMTLNYYEVKKTYDSLMEKNPQSFTEFQDLLDKVVDKSENIDYYNEDVDFTDLKFEGGQPAIPYSLDEMVVTFYEGTEQWQPVAKYSSYLLFAVHNIPELIEEFRIQDVIHTLSKYMSELDFVSLCIQAGIHSNKA